MFLRHRPLRCHEAVSWGIGKQKTDGPFPRGEQRGSQHKALCVSQRRNQQSWSLGPEDQQEFLGPLGIVPATEHLLPQSLFRSSLLSAGLG